MKNYFILGVAALSITSSFAQKPRWEKENGTESYKPLPIVEPTRETQSFDAAGDKRFGRGYNTPYNQVEKSIVKPSEPYQPKVYSLSSGKNEIRIMRSDGAALTKDDYRAAGIAFAQLLNQGLTDTYAESVLVSVIVAQSSSVPSISVERNNEGQVVEILISVGQKTKLTGVIEKYDTLASKILDELTP